ncbi:MAG: protein kinase [Rhizobacter sp.]|nr:protein kinase [Rhizobacter sp.]
MVHTLAQLRSGELAGITRLDLSCGLTEFPTEIYRLADSLEILNLSGNQLDSLPGDLHRLHRLRVVFCSDNRFTGLPSVLGHCTSLTVIGFKANAIERVPAEALPPRLRWLILTDNRIEALPESLGQCGDLQKLMLAGNRLARLPVSMAACRKLELVRIAANRFERLPAWLLELPRLAWIAYGGNPMTKAFEGGVAANAFDTVESIDWSCLELQQRLGEGASGVISRALWHRGGRAQPEPVAVKLFKADMTSDGLPSSEIAACLAVGDHPHLVSACGVLTGHPEGASGMVMRLVAPEFVNLAGPPSLDTCTRDVYDASQRFTPARAMAIAGGIAKAARQMHSHGVLHGDLYGHNTLVSPDGTALLGDFGAASFLPIDNDPSLALQRIEARAFGCLLEELLERCERGAGDAGDAGDAAVVRRLSLLARQCLTDDMAERPTFNAIEDALKP